MTLNLMKVREYYVRLAKQRALQEISEIMSTNGSLFNNYTYTTLRRIYSLSKFSITNSNWPGFLLAEARRLHLLETDELCILASEIDETTTQALFERASKEMEVTYETN